MKRQEVQEIILKQLDRLKTLVEAEPMKATVSAFIFGALFWGMRNLFLPLLVIFAVGAFIVWFFSDKERER
ncbi:hypothetical protein JNK13_03745 [bacterium]|nr:hypothetical protein [bacterium]